MNFVVAGKPLPQFEEHKCWFCGSGFPAANNQVLKTLSLLPVNQWERFEYDFV
jgi:hypothetical protein